MGAKHEEIAAVTRVRACCGGRGLRLWMGRRWKLWMDDGYCWMGDGSRGWMISPSQIVYAMSEEEEEQEQGGSMHSEKEEEEENVTAYLEEEQHEGVVKRVVESRPGRNKRNKRLLKEAAAKAHKRGVCYLSRIPPHMDPLKLRQILSQHGEIHRIYLTPEDSAAQVHRKRASGFRGQEFSEGWVEFTKKGVAKRVANMLNGEQIGGRKRSSFYYDLWNIKYLSKFKWDDLTEEIAYKSAVREQKLALEISAAKRERDFYLNKVDKSRALASIQERMRKKQKIQRDTDKNSKGPVDQSEPKVVRHFPQNRSVSDTSNQSKPRLSRDVLAGVFGGSSS